MWIGFRWWCFWAHKNMSEDDQIFCQCDSLRPSYAAQDSQQMYFCSYLWLSAGVHIGTDKPAQRNSHQWIAKNQIWHFLCMLWFMVVHCSALACVTTHGGEVAHAHITMFKSTPWPTRAQKHKSTPWGRKAIAQGHKSTKAKFSRVQRCRAAEYHCGGAQGSRHLWDETCVTLVSPLLRGWELHSC